MITNNRLDKSFGASELQQGCLSGILQPMEDFKLKFGS